MGDAQTHHALKIGFALICHMATELIDTIKQGFRLIGTTGRRGLLSVVHQMSAIAPYGSHVRKRVSPQCVENHRCRQILMLVPDFSSKLPMAIEIGVVAGRSKSAVRSEERRVGKEWRARWWGESEK